FEGCNLLVRREALEGSGGFSELLEMGGEDTWLGWAVLRGGWERAFAPDTLVHHDVTQPGYRWHHRQAWLMGNLALVAKDFPTVRREFWRPWAMDSSHPALLVFALGVGLYPWRRAAVILTLPYLYIRGWQRRIA